MYARCTGAIKLTVKETQRCKYCQFEAVSSLLLLRHPCQKPLQKNQCDHCDRILSSRCSLQQHMRTQHPISTQQKWYKCQYCPYKALDSSYLRKHSFANHSSDEVKRQKWYQCEHCDYSTAEKCVLKEHVQRRHSDNEFKCTDCEYKTKVKRDLVLHNKRRHTEKVQCEICKSWVSKPDLQHHIATVHVEKKKVFTCDVCDAGFPEKDLFESHLQNAHRSMPIYTCETCTETFRRQDFLDSHVRLKHGCYEAIQCPDCSYKAYTTADLKRHKRKHARTWYKCEFCDFGTLHKPGLANHNRSKHNKDEDITWYKCASCARGFKMKAALKYHIEKKVCLDYFIQDELIWYFCQQCDAKFKANASLQAHILHSHASGAGPGFKCSYCDFTHVQEAVIKAHLSEKHIDQLMECRFCERMFKNDAALKRHLHTFNHSRKMQTLLENLARTEKKFKTNKD